MAADRIDFNRVAMFVQIAEAGGVTAAAEKMKLPKSSVSRGLSQLESELGVELVVRGSRRFRLSDAGRAFFEAASKGIAAVELARDDIREEQATPRGLVRVAAPATQGTWFLAPVVAAYVRAHAGVEVEVAVSRRPLDAIREGFDLALAGGKLADSSLIVRRLGVIDFGIFASAKYLRERGTPRQPSDLSAHECILHDVFGQKGRWELTGPSGVVVATVKGRIRADDFFVVTAAAVEHGGLAVLPTHGADGAMPSLVRVLPDYVVRGEPMQLVYPASRHMPLRVSLLCDAIVAATSSCPSGTMKDARAPNAVSARRRTGS
jgi:DNA-binding transcriptional LysR family regulator